MNRVISDAVENIDRTGTVLGFEQAAQIEPAGYATSGWLDDNYSIRLPDIGVNLAINVLQFINIIYGRRSVINADDSLKFKALGIEKP